MLAHNVYFALTERSDAARARLVAACHKYLAPHAGFQWILPMRLTVGFDVGVQIPIVSDGPSFDAAKYGLVLPVEGQGSVADAARFVAKSPIPVIHFLEIGYAL